MSVFSRLSASRRLSVPSSTLGLSVVASVAAILATACTIPATAQNTGPNTGTNAGHAPLRCEVALEDLGGATRIQGRVHSDRAISGTYTMAVTSRSAGGMANIRQSGDFQAAPDTPALLGETRLMGRPDAQSVDLEIRVEGTRMTCAAL